MKFGKTLEEYKQAYADGTMTLQEDEYLGEDGFPYCKNCKTARFHILEGFDCVMYSQCQCLREKAEAERKREEARKRMEEFNQRKKLALLGERYKNLMFKDAAITEANRDVYIRCKNYVEKSQEIYAHNIGLYIYGDNSSGKTFLTACMCNELVWKGYRCIYTNLASILGEIRSSYDGNGMGECELLRKLQFFDFAFIDDLGKEFLGREFNAASSKWAEEKLFEVLNARYNAKKPTIFSSNYSIKELASTLNLDNAIVARIDEMATRVLKLEGDDFRRVVRAEKSDIAKSLGI